MKLTAESKLNNADYRVIIGSSNNIPSSISNDDRELFTAFLELDEEFKMISTLNSTTFLIKKNDVTEKNRASGAKIRQNLNVDIKEIAFLGS